MKKKIQYKKYFYISIIGIIIIASLFYSLNNNDNYLFDRIKSFISINSINNKNDIIITNELLENEIKELKKEIDELKKINDLKKIITDKKIINASITKRSDKYWYNTITINKGKQDGIKKGYPVITTSGLIGEIDNVNNNSSEVRLITSNNKNYLSAKFTIDNKEYFGIIKKYNILKNELYLENVIGDISNYKDIDVITSGLSNNCPSGLLIGKIKDIKKDKYNLSNTVIINPASDYNNINIVMVIKND